VFLDLRFEKNKNLDTLEKTWTGMCVDLQLEKNENLNIEKI
jgi:hypothetical protein